MYYAKTGKEAFKLAKGISIKERGSIEYDIRKQKEKRIKISGPRGIFIETYKRTGSYLEAKKELLNAGFKSLLNEDDILQKWIKEDIPQDKNKNEENAR